jgi:hypothetical protein
VIFGISGYYYESSQYDDVGGTAYVKIPTLHWLFGSRG